MHPPLNHFAEKYKTHSYKRSFLTCNCILTNNCKSVLNSAQEYRFYPFKFYFCSGDMLRQSQQQKLLQKLSPQQIQLMKLLQIPTVNLEERIKEEMEENPALEVGGEEGQDE